MPAPSADRERRRAVYERVVALHHQGGSITQISGQVGRSRATVRKYLRAGAVPERAPSRRWRAPTTAEAAYLQQRWAEGCHTAAVLWRELRAQGYRGSSVTVRRYVAGWRTAPLRRTPLDPLAGPARPPAAPARAPAPRRVRWWLLRQAEAVAGGDPVPAEAQVYCRRLLERCPAIAEALTLTAAFIRLVRQRDGAALASWLATTRRCPVAECREFARGVARDHAAVAAALTSEWSTGPVEGQITKLKLIKRAMYGRASLPLLRARLLRAA